MAVRFLEFALLALLVAQTNCAKLTKVVETQSGPVQGIVTKTGGGEELDLYLGIPFARPPIGELRFRPTEPVEPWEGLFKADKMPLPCFQRDSSIAVRAFPYMDRIVNLKPYDEDCLKMNIWVPKSQSDEGKLAVMVSIYGGEFAFGGVENFIFQGTELAQTGQVIVVTFNYRVASFGFLYLDHEGAPGNVGLLDQVEAFKWIRANIDAFGGDRDRVTIFGQSAGSASVYYHYISPLSRNLFRRGIFQSGAPNRFLAYNNNTVALSVTLDVARANSCPTNLNDKAAILNCLVEMNATKLANTEVESLQGTFLPLFRPIVDGTFINECPLHTFKKGEFKQTESLVGTVTHEATLFFVAMSENFISLIGTEPNMNKELFLDAVYVRDPDIPESVADLMVDRYYKERQSHKEDIESANGFMSDLVFNCPLKLQVGQMLDHSGTVYRYVFSYRTLNNSFPNWMGAQHGSEQEYIFGHPIRDPSSYSPEERQLSILMIKQWSNFAKYGNPNQGADTPKWPRVSKEDDVYLHYDELAMTSLARNYKVEECEYWLHSLPKTLLEKGTALNPTDLCSMLY